MSYPVAWHPLPGINLLSLLSTCRFFAVTDSRWPGRIRKSFRTSRKPGFLPSSMTDALTMFSLAGSHGTTRWSTGMRDVIFKTMVSLEVENGRGAIGNRGLEESLASWVPPPTRQIPLGLKKGCLISNDFVQIYCL